MVDSYPPPGHSQAPVFTDWSALNSPTNLAGESVSPNQIVNVLPASW
jgi:hypothetical protein